MNIHTVHIGMNEQSRIRTVKVNERGQIVIPEDLRKELGIEPNTVLVLLGKGKEIMIRREEDLLADLDEVWRKATHRALDEAWDKEDEIWDHLSKEERG